MLFTENLSWDSHIRDRILKAASTLNTLNRCIRIIPRIVKEYIYKTLIRPILEYGCTIYDNCPLYVSNYLEKSQRSAALACTCAYKDTSHTTLMQELSWSPLNIRRNYLKLCQLHKIICEACPPYVNDLLRLERSVRQYELRNYSKLKLFRIRTETYRKSFLPSSTRLWNSLTPNLRDYTSHNTFKKPWSEISSQSQTDSSLTVQEKDLSIMQGIDGNIIIYMTLHVLLAITDTKV